MNVAVETLGCKVNLYESEQIAYRMRGKSPEGADGVCVINTCTVTREADRQSRQTIRKAVRNHPGSLIVVTGCYAEMQPDECAQLPGVDLVVPGSRKLEIPDLIAGRKKAADGPDVMAPSPDGALPGEIPVGFESRSRAFVQIQQGCDNGCTFCIIHKARGPSRSILPTAINRQIESFANRGFREIVLCGIDLGAYGMDLNAGGTSQISLAALAGHIAQRHRDLRIRLSSIDPAHIGEDLIEVFRENGNICPHIHLSLQSAAPIILKRMKRRYTKEDAYRAVAILRESLPDLVLSADIMTGFPTETESDFEQTVTAVRELQIAYPHVFAYSQRSGTPAARIPNQVPAAVRKSRAARLRRVGEQVRKDVLTRYVGRTCDALVESRCARESALVRTRMANYLPVYVPADRLDAGAAWCRVRVTGFEQDGLCGETVS